MLKRQSRLIKQENFMEKKKNQRLIKQKNFVQKKRALEERK